MYRKEHTTQSAGERREVEMRCGCGCGCGHGRGPTECIGDGV